jgi:lipoprotein-releasing system permease protein
VLTLGPEMVMTGWQDVEKKVARQPGVVAVAPFVFTQALAQSGQHRYMEGVYLLGIPPAGPGAQEVTGIRSTATGGDFSFATKDGQRRGAVVGAKLADRLMVTPGIDSIKLVTVRLDKINPVTGMSDPYVEQFEVTGIFSTGMYEYDNNYVILSLETAQRLAQLGTAVTGLEVKTPSRWDAPEVALRLQDSLGMPFRTVDWREQNHSLFNALKLEKLGMSVILLLIVLVAAFNIMSTLIMVVTDKTREIGILRAMGMSARSIRRIFFAQGVIIGVAGTFVGLVIGLVTSVAIGRGKLIPLDAAVYYIDHLPISTEPLDVALIVLASLAVAAIATIYPARQAARLYPVEAIRHE